MELRVAQTLMYELKSEGFLTENIEIYKNYSGRGMFGATTTGLVVGRYDFHTVVGKLKRLGLLFGKTGFRIDNLGLNYIIY